MRCLPSHPLGLEHPHRASLALPVGKKNEIKYLLHFFFFCNRPSSNLTRKAAVSSCNLNNKVSCDVAHAQMELTLNLINYGRIMCELGFGACRHTSY